MSTVQTGAAAISSSSSTLTMNTLDGSAAAMQKEPAEGIGRMTHQSDQDKKVERMSAAVRELLECLGEDPEREGLVKTPHRVAKALLAVTSGYHQTPAAIVGDALFDCSSREMVLVRDIECNSMCEHHMLPFFGRVHVAYLPDGRVVGLSKLARLVDCFAKRLQIQERMVQQIAEAVASVVGARGVAVMAECT
jgi:GTP cyclohydrolase IA